MINNFRERAKALVEQRQKAMLQEASALREEYGDYAKAVVEGYQKKFGAQIPDNILIATLQSLQNFTREELLRETTVSGNLGTFADYGYQLIAATLPNLVTNEIASLQPLKVRNGIVWYLSYKNPTARGQAAANTHLLDAKTGPPDYIHMTSQTIFHETGGTGNATTVSFSISLGYTPVTPGTIVITAGSVIATDDGNGAFTGSGINTGASSVTSYTNGTVVIVFNSPVAASTVVYVDYKFAYESKTANINEIDIDLAQLTVDAEQFKLRARYSLDAAFDLQQVQGVNADDMIVSALASIIRSDIDRIIMAEILANATANTNSPALTFDATVPQYIPVKAHYDGFFIKAVKRGSNRIFQRTKMVDGNFIICGTNVSTIAESIDGYVANPISGSFSGPHVAGTLRGIKVIKNPHYDPSAFVIGHKGGDYLDCGYVFAPYRALYLSPAVVLDDDTARRGMAMSAGHKMVNVDMFVAGSVTNF